MSLWLCILGFLVQIMLHSHGFHVDEDNSITFKTSIDLKLQQNRAWKLKKKSLLVQTSFHEGKFLCLCGYIIIKFFGSKSPLLLQFSYWWSQLYNFNFNTLTSLEIQQNSAWKLEKITLNIIKFTLNVIFFTITILPLFLYDYKKIKFCQK